MATGDWRKDRSGRVRALKPGDSPPVSTLVEAFEGQDVTAADAIVLRGYLARSDIVERVRVYLKRALRISQGDAETTTTTSLTKSITDELSWPDTRKNAVAEGERAAEEAARAVARAAGLAKDQIDEVLAEKTKEPSDPTKTRVKNVNDAAELLKDEPTLAPVLRYAAAVIPAQERADRVEEVLKKHGIEDEESRKQLASALTTAGTAELELLMKSLDAVTRLSKPHLPWRLYLSPRLDRYVDFHPSSLIAWRREPKVERQDACTIWLRVFEKGAQVPILYRLVSETTLVPSFATWINGQLVDDYSDEGVVSSAWGDQSISGAKGTGPLCNKGTSRLCLD
jgi:hypothetical protein